MNLRDRFVFCFVSRGTVSVQLDFYDCTLLITASNCGLTLSGKFSNVKVDGRVIHFYVLGLGDQSFIVDQRYVDQIQRFL